MSLNDFEDYLRKREGSFKYIINLGVENMLLNLQQDNLMESFLLMIIFHDMFA